MLLKMIYNLDIVKKEAQIHTDIHTHTSQHHLLYTQHPMMTINSSRITSNLTKKMNESMGQKQSTD